MRIAFMPDIRIDPARLAGDALVQWYQRSPADLDQERQQAAARRYRDFFYQGAGDPDPEVGGEVPASGQDVDPGFGMPPPSSPEDADPGFAQGPASSGGSLGIAANGQSIDATYPVTGFGGDAISAASVPRLAASCQPGASLPPRSTYQALANAQPGPPTRQPPIDPSRTPVYQTGPDGKLHPIPGWHTTGPFDFGAWAHNIHWGGVAKDLGEIGTGIAVAFGGAGLADDLLSALGPDAEAAVADGIADSPAGKAAADAIHGHHAEPKFMGGAVDQELVPLQASLHRALHGALAKALGDEGFPPVGGINGSAIKWAKHFELNPGSREEAMEILRRVSREFDQMYGTNISSKLAPAPPPPGGEAPPPT
jgi:hypothetical protein